MAAKKFRKSKFSCPVGGFVGERCLKHRASSMNDAHVRKSHAIDRFHAWVDRSRSHGFMRPCLDFHYRMGLRVDVLNPLNHVTTKFFKGIAHANMSWLVTAVRKQESRHSCLT